MEISVWIAFAGLSFIYCLVPGPSVCFTIAHSIQHGISRTNLTIVGQIMGNSFYIMLICFGLGGLITNSIAIFHAVKYTGAAYIVYLGIKQILSGESHFEFQIHSIKKSRIKSFFDGFVICGTNPKTFFYYAAFLPQFVFPHLDKRIQLIGLGSASIVIAFFALMIYNLAAKKAKDLFLTKNFFHHIHYITGSLLIISGVSLGFL